MLYPVKAISKHHIDGLVQEIRNSSALAMVMELRLSCTNPLIYTSICPGNAKSSDTMQHSIIVLICKLSLIQKLSVIHRLVILCRLFWSSNKSSSVEQASPPASLILEDISAYHKSLLHSFTFRIWASPSHDQTAVKFSKNFLVDRDVQFHIHPPCFQADPSTSNSLSCSLPLPPSTLPGCSLHLPPCLYHLHPPSSSLHLPLGCLHHLHPPSSSLHLPPPIMISNTCSLLQFSKAVPSSSLLPTVPFTSLHTVVPGWPAAAAAVAVATAVS